jgi:hypothetical protein
VGDIMKYWRVNIECITPISSADTAVYVPWEEKYHKTDMINGLTSDKSPNRF